jgi:CxxC-x17-CxxC domain-containing protein
MKKPKAAKAARKSKKARTEQAPTPDLVHVMLKLVERMTALEQKLEQVLGRVAGLPQEIASARASEPARPPEHGVVRPGQEPHKGRVMHKVICADCCKETEVPFRPVPGRPVYCKPCFTLRKSGHIPQDPDQRSTGPDPEKRLKYTPPDIDYTPPPAPPKSARPKPASRKAAKKKRK